MINKHWQLIFNNLDILEKIKDKGYFIIKKDIILRSSRDRHMVEWKTNDDIPEMFSNNKLDLLYLGNHNYMIATFNLRETIPNNNVKVYSRIIDYVENFETIKIDGLSSIEDVAFYLNEASFVNEFFKEESNLLTKNTYESKISLSYNIGIKDKNYKIKVTNTKVKADALFENEDSITIVKISTDFTNDLLISELYYPYIYFKEKYSKNTRFLFVQYFNNIFRLIEYRFADKETMDSLEWLDEKRYSLLNTELSLDDIGNLLKTIVVSTDDNMDDTDVPFIQANSFDKVISMLDYLKCHPSTKNELANFLKVGERQVDYYFNAGRYLGLFDKKIESNKHIYILSSQGISITNFDYRERYLKLISLILEHQIFNDIFHKIFEEGTLPTKDEVLSMMQKYNVCAISNTTGRRADSVLAWMKWILELVDSGSDD